MIKRITFILLFVLYCFYFFVATIIHVLVWIFFGKNIIHLIVFKNADDTISKFLNLKR